MLKMIIPGLLGFFTLPLVGMALWGVTTFAGWIGGFGMEPEHYWAGFFMPVAIGVLFACTLPLWAN